jgi:hypothetical protein
MMVYFNFAFVNKQTYDLDKYKQLIESKFLVEQKIPYNKYMDPHNFLGFLEWLQCKVLNVTSNLM